MNNQCPICSKNCLLSNLQCEKGQKYFQQDLTNKLIKCGHILTHKTGKKRSQENILEILLKHKEISQRELQEILDIEAGSMSEIIAKLEQREYIKRYKDERDKRRYIISVSYTHLDVYKRQVLENGEEIKASYVVLAPGRDGSTWLTKVLKNQGLDLYNNQVDIGVRVETNNIVMDEINKNLYEGKFVYNASVGTKVRTFCSNPSGHVVVENHSGTMLANGHAYHDPKLGSPNTNFALLVSHVFSEPFNEPNEFAHEVARLANMLSHGSIIVQRYGDIKRGRRTTEKRLKEGYTIPTLPEAVPGDLGLVLPYNTMKSIIEMIEALDHVTPGIANEHTLLYGVEAKFYSARPKVREGFESEIDGLYVGGDGAGLTRGLAQAGANGILIARDIIKRIK